MATVGGRGLGSRCTSVVSVSKRGGEEEPEYSTGIYYARERSHMDIYKCLKGLLNAISHTCSLLHVCLL